jgi:SagB-type dehydrogenase family enzyme
VDAKPVGGLKTSPSDSLAFNPWVIIYRDFDTSGALVVEDLGSKRRFEVDDPILVSLILAAGRGIGAISTEAANLQLVDKDLLDAIATLQELQVLCPADSAYVRESAAAKVWRERYWHDSLVCYRAIRDFPFLDYESPAARAEDGESMAAHAAIDSPPLIYREHDPPYPRVFLHRDLDQLHKVDVFQLLVDEVESGRACFPESIDLGQISTLLYASFGETGWVEFPHQGRFLLKTSPSGGARHPTEAYVYSIDTELPQGIYHYSVGENALVRLPQKVEPDLLLDAAYELRTGPHFPVRLVVVLTSVVARSMWRYREPRSYRVLLNDVGHVLETLKIVTKAVGLETYFGHGFHDDQLEQLLGVSSAEEPALKIVAIG